MLLNKALTTALLFFSYIKKEIRSNYSQQENQ